MVVFAASPASAHGVGGIQPTNYRTTVATRSRRRAGVGPSRSVDLGNRLELQNTSGRDVIVAATTASPTCASVRAACSRTRARRPCTSTGPPRPSPPGRCRRPPTRHAPPVWRKIVVVDDRARHDHRAHWMGTCDPGIVARDPGSPHLVQEFTIHLRARAASCRRTAWSYGSRVRRRGRGSGSQCSSLDPRHSWWPGRGGGTAGPAAMLAILMVAEALHVSASGARPHSRSGPTSRRARTPSAASPSARIACWNGSRGGVATPGAADSCAPGCSSASRAVSPTSRRSRTPSCRPRSPTA